MKLLRRLFNGHGATSRQRRNVPSRRSWISKGVEQLEGRRLMACLPASDLALSSSSIDENLPAGTTVGVFSTGTPGLQASNFTYAFEGGPDYLDNENFFLTGDALKTRASLDFESISSYQVNIRSTDADGNSISKIFTINVNDLQEAPTANDDAFVTAQDTPVSGNVLANDVDDAGDVLTATMDTEAANGTVELNEDGSFTYTPNSGFVGTDSFTYTVTDDKGNSDVGTVTVVVDPLNDSPVAGDDSYTTDEDVALTGNVLVNDTDADGDSFTAALGEGPTNGSVVLNADGSFTYTPNADYFGEDSFTYTVDDGQGGTATGTVSITIVGVNDAPEAADDAFTTEEDTAVSGNVLENDVDVDGDVLTAILGDQPTNGAVVLNADGTFTYTPNADFNGTDTFTYTIDDGNGGSATGTVTITVNAANDGPLAGDDSFTTDEDVPVSGNVLVNDTDADGDAITAALALDPTNGSVVLNADGSFTYTPNANYFGEDSFTYTVDDGQGGTATGTVTITIGAVNDAPEAADDAFTTEEDTAVSGNVLENDSDVDGDTLTATLGEGPTNGVVELGADGNFTYTPNADFNGTDTFTYTIDDGNGGSATGTVTITVNTTNDGPLAGDDSFTTDEDVPVDGNVLVNDTDADGDAITAALAQGPTNGTVTLNADGSFTYTPNADYFGEDSFTYTVDDGQGGTATGTVTITIAAVNDAPIAGDDAYSGDQETAVLGNVLENDSDVDGDTLTATLGEGPTNGVVELGADGNFTYTPNAGFYGVDTFTYTIDDGAGGTATAMVTITVNQKETPPASVDDSVVTNEDVAAVIPISDLLANDADRDGNIPTFVAAGGAVNGTVSVSDGNVVFTPAPDFYGTGSFVYATQNSAGEVTFATVTVTVNAMPDSPVAMDDSASTAAGTPVTIPASSLLANDTDADGDTLSMVAVGGASNGTVSLVDGNVTFTPGEGFTGTATFRYIVSDGNDGYALGTVNVEVTAAEDTNSPPVATDDIIKGGDADELMIAVADLLANDFDSDGDPLMLTGVDNAVGGTVTLTDTGISFVRDANFTGVATFNYTIDDGRGGTATGQVSVELNNGSQDPPDIVDGGDDDNGNDDGGSGGQDGGSGDNGSDDGENCEPGQGHGKGHGKGQGKGHGRGQGRGLGRGLNRLV